MKFELVDTHHPEWKWGWQLVDENQRPILIYRGFNSEGAARRALKAWRKTVAAADVYVAKQGGDNYALEA